MKFIIKFSGSFFLTVCFLIILLSGCNQKDAGKGGDTVPGKTGDTTAAGTDDTGRKNRECLGYTGKITDPRAEKLISKCHFIPVELIVEWTARYQKSKQRYTQEKLPDIGTVLGDSSSFNSCIIRKIITNEKCIGLRVVYGMSEDKKIHVIMVGINPDYSSLYIKQEEACCEINAKALGAAPPPPGKLGGAEYGQMP